MKKAGFTLIELMVVIAIIGILGVVITPVVGKAIQKANAAKIIALTNALETASEMYYNDTGQYAMEYANRANPSYATPYYHRLAMDPNTDVVTPVSVPNWDGPYIKAQLSEGDNPYKQETYLYGPEYAFAVIPFTSVGGAGFDLDASGVPETLGLGNCLMFGRIIPESVAQKVNDAFDGTGETSWQGQGRVEYRVVVSGGVTYRDICIYLAGG